jgi:hypothetical protein
MERTMEGILDENVAAAFDLLLQEMSLVVDHERGCGADTFRHGDYSEADRRRLILRVTQPSSENHRCRSPAGYA